MAQDTSQENIVITAIEARTPVGSNIVTSAAAIRAGICGLREHPDYYPLQKYDEDEYLISAGIDPSINDFSWQRLIQLIEKPFLSFIADAGFERKQFQDGALWFALPNADPVIQQISLQKHFLAHFIDRFALPKKCDFAGVQLGATGISYLINKAREVLLSGERKFLIVAAVDSFMLDGRLSYYDDQWRLKSERNPMGFIPGEASALLLLEMEANAKARKKTPLLQVSSIGIAQEGHPITGDESSTGAGLSQAIEQALSNNAQQPVKWLYSDLNGESYRAYEWGVTNTRLSNYFDPQFSHIHLADVIGDVGSASTAIQLGCISQAFQQDYAVDSSALVFSANDKGQRAALCVSRPTL
jgi:3-oxoacyl-[acyl-carrier-protein] synthase-1